jgi:hypothetical protein
MPFAFPVKGAADLVYRSVNHAEVVEKYDAVIAHDLFAEGEIRQCRRMRMLAIDECYVWRRRYAGRRHILRVAVDAHNLCDALRVDGGKPGEHLLFRVAGVFDSIAGNAVIGGAVRPWVDRKYLRAPRVGNMGLE